MIMWRSRWTMMWTGIYLICTRAVICIDRYIGCCVCRQGSRMLQVQVSRMAGCLCEQMCSASCAGREGSRCVDVEALVYVVR